jgi:hypothetical protein
LAQLNPFLARYGLSATEMALLITGGHGIAGTENHFANSGINSFTSAFISSGIDYISVSVNKPSPWIFFDTWFGLKLDSFPQDPHFDPEHGNVIFQTRDTIGRFNTDLMFFPSEVIRSEPVVHGFPNATVEPADNAQLSAIETKLRSYLKNHPALWELDFVKAYNKMSRIGTEGYTITDRNLVGWSVSPSCQYVGRKDIGFLTKSHLGLKENSLKQLVKGSDFGRISIPRDYSFTFSVTPIAVSSSLTNILHATAVTIV